MAHCVSHPSGLFAEEFAAILDAIGSLGSEWRSIDVSCGPLSGLISRVGVTALDGVHLTALAIQYMRNADTVRASRQW